MLPSAGTFGQHAEDRSWWRTQHKLKARDAIPLFTIFQHSFFPDLYSEPWSAKTPWRPDRLRETGSSKACQPAPASHKASSSIGASPCALPTADGQRRR
eukprot:6189809-Pleurochrysis_carterae.AAC.1